MTTLIARRGYGTEPDERGKKCCKTREAYAVEAREREERGSYKSTSSTTNWAFDSVCKVTSFATRDTRFSALDSLATQRVLDPFSRSLFRLTTTRSNFSLHERIFNPLVMFGHQKRNGHAESTSKKMKNGSQDVANDHTSNGYTFEKLQESANYLLERTSIRPKIAIICGSGMGSLADALTEKICFPYESIPNFPISTVQGHVGQLVFGKLEGIPIMCMQGRFHYYEGYPLWKCSMPVRVMKLIGVAYLIATNAAGGLNPAYKTGDIMIVRDHVNMMGFAGNNPLQGPNDDRFGPRFPPMNKAYNLELQELALKVAEQMNITDIVHKGVYTCLGGPNFETVAELKMLRMVGVDAVGMSTVHEVITARHCDMTVFAFSLITNQCATDYDAHLEANHEEVMDVGRSLQPMLQEFVSRMVRHLAKHQADIRSR